MHKKFEINQTKIKDGCQSGIKVVTHNSKRDLPVKFECTYVIKKHIVEVRVVVEVSDKQHT